MTTVDNQQYVIVKMFSKWSRYWLWRLISTNRWSFNTLLSHVFSQAWLYWYHCSECVEQQLSRTRFRVTANTLALSVTFNNVFSKPWLTCFGTTRVAHWINLLPNMYIFQVRRRIVLLSFFALWSLLAIANGNDEFATTLRKLQQPDNFRAEPVADKICEQVLARQSLSDKL